MFYPLLIVIKIPSRNGAIDGTAGVILELRWVVINECKQRTNKEALLKILGAFLWDDPDQDQ